MIRHVPLAQLDELIVATDIDDQPQAHWLDDSTILVALVENDDPTTRAVTVFDPRDAARDAHAFVVEHAVPTDERTTSRLGFPVASINDLWAHVDVFHQGGMNFVHRVNETWPLADERASPVHVFQRAGGALLLTWWDELGAKFDFPVAVVANRPSPLEEQLAAKWGGLQLHQFTGPTPR